MAILVRRTIGKKGHFVKLVVDRVLMPAVLHVCEIWSYKVANSTNRKILLAETSALHVLDERQTEYSENGEDPKNTGM